MNLAGVAAVDLLARLLGARRSLAAGNVFCMACPFMLPRELGRRLGRADTRLAARRCAQVAGGRAARRLLRGPTRRSALGQRRRGRPGSSSATSSPPSSSTRLFRGASFCKYVCPIGQFHFVGSLVSPLEVKVRAARTSAPTCTTQDCLRGNATPARLRARPVPAAQGRATSTARSASTASTPARTTTSASSRSARPRAGARPRASSVGPASRSGRISPRWRSSSCSPPSRTPSPWSGRPRRPGSRCRGRGAGARRGTRRATAAPRRSGLVPLGIAMWAAHLAFHLATGWPSLVPAIVQAMHLGTRLVGRPRPRRRALLGVQLLLLDAGLLLSLYVAWRVAWAGGGSCRGPRSRRACGWPARGFTCSPCRCGEWCIDAPARDRGSGAAVLCRRGSRGRRARPPAPGCRILRDHGLHSPEPLAAGRRMSACWSRTVRPGPCCSMRPSIWSRPVLRARRP